ncbi:kappa-type opioid receptor [Pelobates cultripes]|uniref:Kappa-type opioid receptor n=1 Tax=Pelobates cultripes TaxID=61616 RepID=A0AAD1S163_PELCU|nr:kappa-type opioid receptor [Pelobates cultripes]
MNKKSKSRLRRNVLVSHLFHVAQTDLATDVSKKNGFTVLCYSMLMESPVQIFREGEMGQRLLPEDITCSPGCAPPCSTGCPNSSWLLGWGDYDNNSEYSDSPAHESNHTSISPTLSVIITAVYSMVFVVGLVGNALVMFVIIRFMTVRMPQNIVSLFLSTSIEAITGMLSTHPSKHLVDFLSIRSAGCDAASSGGCEKKHTDYYVLTLPKTKTRNKWCPVQPCNALKARTLPPHLRKKCVNLFVWLLLKIIIITEITQMALIKSEAGADVTDQLLFHYFYFRTDLQLYVCMCIYLHVGVSVPVYLCREPSIANIAIYDMYALSPPLESSILADTIVTVNNTTPEISIIFVCPYRLVDDKERDSCAAQGVGCPNSSWLLGWGDYDNNSEYSDSPAHESNHTSISPTLSVIITAVYSMVFVVGLVGNALVMFVIIRYTKMKTATNIYIFNLALADALVTTTMPFQSTSFLMSSWPFGDVLCKIVVSIDYYNMFTSIFTLTMMSVDRYIAVCHPVKALDFRTPLKAKCINVFIWMLSSSVGISAIVLGGTKIVDGQVDRNSHLEQGATIIAYQIPDCYSNILRAPALLLTSQHFTPYLRF